MTITEGLAEIKTIVKRIAKKQDAVLDLVWRFEGIKDSMLKEGGAEPYVKTEMQAIEDLDTRILSIRQAINRVNGVETITLQGTVRNISEWLIWRREIVQRRKEFFDALAAKIQDAKSRAQKAGNQVYASSGVVPGPGEAKIQDITLNISELEINKERERIETILGELDGQLSLKNATVQLEGI